MRDSTGSPPPISLEALFFHAASASSKDELEEKLRKVKALLLPVGTVTPRILVSLSTGSILSHPNAYQSTVGSYDIENGVERIHKPAHSAAC